jgi:hypothetical protein
MAGSDDGGEPSEGGAPSGGRGGVSGLGGLGGTGNGGNSTAGASTAGAGGVRVPDGCEPGSQFVGGAYCSTAMTCDGHQLNISCSVNAGIWMCSCTNGPSRVDYDFPIATGVSTCEAAAKACANPDLLTGDENCTRTRTMGVSACAIHDTCETLHVIDGVTLRTRRARDATCNACSDPVGSCCHCTNPNVTDYRLRDANLGAGCDFLDELCKPDNVDLVGGKTCQPLWEQDYPDYACMMAAECGQPILVGDGTRFTLTQQFTTTCYDRDEGFRCTCTNDEHEYALAVDFGMMPANISTCRVATAACAGVEPIEPTGPRACTASTDIAVSDACTLYLDCVEPATLAGANVTVFTKVGAQCDRQPDGSYSCYCNQRTSGPYAIEAEDTRSACEQAVDEVCPVLAPAI